MSISPGKRLEKSLSTRFAGCGRPPAGSSERTVPNGSKAPGAAADEAGADDAGDDNDNDDGEGEGDDEDGTDFTGRGAIMGRGSIPELLS
jgi:hypothetical protein